MQRTGSRSWNLESFLDSLVVELDKAQDTLAVKGVTRPLTYSVKELNLDLNIFPHFDGKVVRFVDAKPGETGASKISLQLGSITSEQIRRTTAGPLMEDDIDIESVEGIDDEVKDSLRKYGVRSARDLEQLERRNVDMEKVSTGKIPVGETKRRKAASYRNLASMINQARRARAAPSVSQISLSKEADQTILSLEGKNLVVTKGVEGFPAAMLGRKEVPVVTASDTGLRIAIDLEDLQNLPQKMQIALDPFAVIKMNLNPPKEV